MGKAVVEQNPAFIYTLESQCLISLGKYTEAREMASKAMGITPDYIPAILMRHPPWRWYRRMLWSDAGPFLFPLYFQQEYSPRQDSVPLQLSSLDSFILKVLSRDSMTPTTTIAKEAEIKVK